MKNNVGFHFFKVWERWANFEIVKGSKGNGRGKGYPKNRESLK